MAFELTGNPLNDISAPIEELSESFNSTLVFDFGNGVGITQYTFWMIIICAIVLVGVLVGVRKIKVVPEGKFAGLVEWGYDAVRRNMGEGAIGHGYKKHIPFIATMFFFILISNVIGLIPGAKTPTGTLSVTFVNTICNDKINNLPEDFKGKFVVEESYYEMWVYIKIVPRQFLFHVATTSFFT